MDGVALFVCDRSSYVIHSRKGMLDHVVEKVIHKGFEKVGMIL